MVRSTCQRRQPPPGEVISEVVVVHLVTPPVHTAVHQTLSTVSLLLLVLVAVERVIPSQWSDTIIILCFYHVSDVSIVMFLYFAMML